MLGVIVNEEKIVEKALEGKLLIDNQSKVVHLLIKYYCGQGKTDMLEIKEEIFKVMSKCDSEFTRPKWNEYLEKQIFKYLKNKERYNSNDDLIHIENIKITKKELEIIDSLKDKKLQKIAFILLVYVKIDQQLHKNNSEWINYALGNIFKESKVKGDSKTKMKLLHELSRKELIANKLNNRKCSIKINYINNESEPMLIIDVLEGVIYYYLNYLGEHWKKCINCSKWFVVKGNSPRKYCTTCSKDMDKENKLKYWNENKEKLNDARRK